MVTACDAAVAGTAHAMPRSQAGAETGRRRHLAIVVRAGDWWDYKLPPALLLFYLGVWRSRGSIADVWAQMAMLLAGIVAAAVYVSILNDWTDRAEDRIAGKPNRLAGRGRSLAIAMMTGAVMMGAALLWHWRDDPPAALCYAGTWLAFALYSVPPVRLKARGAWGVLADAAGSNLFPGLLAIHLADRATGLPGDWRWSLIAGCWIFCFGVRGIVWHQLFDVSADRLSATDTFVQRHGEHRAAAIVARGVFPIELAAAAGVIVQFGLLAACGLLAAYLLLIASRHRLFATPVTIVRPRPHATVLLQEYHDTLLPLLVVARSASVHWADVVVLAAHLALFWRKPWSIVHDSGMIVRRLHAAAQRSMGGHR